jgi:hypothetical protein
VNAMVVCHVCLAILLGIGRADGIEIGADSAVITGLALIWQRGVLIHQH